MPPLSTELRTQLSNAIKAARREAEAGAHKALQSQAVDRHEPHASMTPDERSLRNRLRAHGRQLGDVRQKAKGTQSIDRLAHEVAYEHWHRMLFARFLAENHLLIEPETGVTITMEECEELARDEGEDPRALAARFAQASLPQIFRPDDPALEVDLAPEVKQALDKLLESLPDAVFTADDSLGWTYQYWQAEKKDAVNESGNKIGADELPAVTQLFTEHYMVQFLYHNTIGAWHAGKTLASNPRLAKTAQTEDELREAVRLRSEGGYDFEYLRFVRESQAGDDEDKPTGPWRPAAGTFAGWPKAAKDLKVLDPCCGSGHFLVEGFNLLVRLRIDEEGVDLGEAIEDVLADSIHGLELDPRCTQIAAFNLAMAAWKLTQKAVSLPPLHIACSGLAVGGSRDEWAKLAGNDQRLLGGMQRTYDLFEQALELGSLIDPTALEGDLLLAEFAELQPLLEQALARESSDPEEAELAVAAQGMAKAAQLLAGEYNLVVTNPPYLARGKQSDVVKKFCSRYYGAGEADLATVFFRRFASLAGASGTHASVTPLNWLFIKSYGDLRRDLFLDSLTHLVGRAGSAIEAKASWDVLRALAIISPRAPEPTDTVASVDAPSSDEFSRATELRREPVRHTTVEALKKVPGLRFVLGYQADAVRLADLASSFQGIATADYARFGRYFWEIPASNSSWEYQQSTVSSSQPYSGREHVLLWENGEGELARSRKARVQGLAALGKYGVAITQTRKLPATLFTGELFDNNVAALVVHDIGDLEGVWCFCSSQQFGDAVRRFDEKLGVTNATFLEVSYDRDHWNSVAAERYPHGLPKPYSEDPRQWVFHGHPAKAAASTILQVAVARLLGFRWPTSVDTRMPLSEQARGWVARAIELDDYADDDGVVCLLPTRGERAASDRLRELLERAFGPDWSLAKERELLAFAAGGSKPADSLDTWLRDHFFDEHCKLFHHRPFIWHIWDGSRQGFHCLVNAHRLTGSNREGRRTLEAIAYSYLGDWIDRQKSDELRGKEGASERLIAARDLQEQLARILQGEPPLDLFVRWKPLQKQAIGWDPDISDGVRLNIRPFMKAALRKGGKKGAGLLRQKPNITWSKVKGKEPLDVSPKSDFPWLWGCDGSGAESERTNFVGMPSFDGNRWNDLHYTSEFKRAARDGSGEDTAS